MSRVWLRYYKDGVFHQEVTFGNIEIRVNELKQVFVNHGLGKGDRVLVALQNSPKAVETYLALRESEMIAVPVHPKESSTRLEFIRRHAGVKASVTEKGLSVYTEISTVFLADYLKDTTTIIYTSGTTGRPKGVCLGEQQWKENAVMLNRHHHINENTVHGSPLPLFHCNAHGFSMIGTHVARCRYILFDRITDAFLDIINQEHISIVSLVPALLMRLVQKNPDWRPHSDFRYIVTAAAPLSRALLEEVMEKWKVHVVQGYGLSESTNFSCTLPIDLPDAVYQKVMLPQPSIGVALPGVDICVGEDDAEKIIGELKIRSRCNCFGYWGRDKPPGEWLPTGDLGLYRIIQGKRFYYITGSIKEQINRGGETLSPIAIEDELRQCGATGEFAVVSIPDQRLGEEVGLVCVGEVSQSVIDQLPYRYRPKRVVVVEALPQTATGKVQRRKAAQLFTE